MITTRKSLVVEMNDKKRDLVASAIQGVLEGKKDSKLIEGHGEVILAIEDEEMLRDFLRTILEESGYNVILAADGNEGLRTYMENRNNIDIVLLDMGLPGMSGEDVLSRIVSSNPEAKVISVSGYIEPEVETGALRNGAVDYLPKPYLIDELLLKLYHTLHMQLRLAM